MSVRRSAGLTDTGRKRRRNEDSYVHAPPLFAVADGMGGAQAGEVASQLAAGALEETDRSTVHGAGDIVELIQEANRRVYARSTEDPSVSGMGTTMTLALVEDGLVTIGHVGDSRAYRVRDGELEQLTEDHSLVNELLKTGKLSPKEAELHPQRSVSTRALGTDPDVDVEIYSIETREGDLFLLCSDGLTSMVPEGQILALLESHRDDLAEAAKVLIQAANRSGGEDNITVVTFDIGPPPAEGDVTMRLPAQADDDEDTLSGLEPVPAVDTMVVPAADVARIAAAEARSAPPERRPMPRGPRARLIVTMLLLLGVAAALVVWGLVH